MSRSRAERKREVPNTAFLAKVVKNTVGINEYQDKKEARERNRAEELQKLKRRRYTLYCYRCIFFAVGLANLFGV